MIELKVVDILNMVEPLKKLSSTSLSAKTAFYAARTIKKCEEEMANFQDARMKIIDKYAEKKEDGEFETQENGDVKLKSESIGDFNKEMSDLLNSPIELNVNKFRLDDLEDVHFTPTEIAGLEALIEE